MIESLVKLSKGVWQISSSKPPAAPSVFILSSLKDSRAEAGTSSLVSFVNAISIVDVRRSHDGIKRRGLTSKT
jgi:hypothetical protein